MSLPSGTVTLLLADVEGSVRLWERDRDSARDALAELGDAAAKSVAEHEGYRPVEQGEGDNLVAVFERASDALACAVDIQRGARDDGPRYRMALHTGEVDVRDGRYEGDAINRCARLRDLAHGGQVLVSRTAHDLVVERLPEGATLVGLGSVTLRDIVRPEDVFEVQHPELPAGFPPLQSTPTAHLPRQLTSFIGREDEVAAVTELLREARLVTLTGAGGCGKTRLALQVAGELAGGYPDGVWWVDLGLVSDGTRVAAALAAVLPELRGDGGHADLAVGFLSARRALVVLDNCEHLVEASADLAQRLVTGCPQVSVLATSRELLGVLGEVAWRVPSMSLSRPEDEPDVIAASDSVRLFVDRARSARPNFTAAAAEVAVLAEICERLDGIPLAIELAASRTRSMTPRQIAEALDDRFRVLGSERRGALARHRTLEASVAWSYDLLDERARTMLARLSVFRGGFTLDAAEDVCAGEGIDRLDVLPVLSDLCDRSLVQADEGRYRLLETIRQYAARLARTDEMDAVRTRHLDHYVEVAESVEPDLAGPNVGTAVEALTLEEGNLEAAMDHGGVTGRLEGVLRIASAIATYWWIRGNAAEIRRRVEAALDAEDVDVFVRIRALLAGCRVGLLGYSPPWAKAFGERAVSLARSAGDDLTLGRASATLGAAFGLTEPDVARPLIDEAIEASTKAGDYASLKDALAARYFVSFSRGDVGEAVASMRASLDAARSTDDVHGTGIGLGVLGQLLVFRGQLPEAETAFEESIRILREVGDVQFEDWAVAGLAWIAMWRGQPDRAAAAMEAVIARSRRSGWVTRLNFLFQRAQADHVRGTPDGGEPSVDELVDVCRDLLPVWLGAPLRMKADILRLRGDLDGAGAALDAAADAMHPGDGIWRGGVLEGVGRIARARGDLGAAEDAHHDALRMLVHGEGFVFVPDTLESLAALAALAESDAEAARLFGAAEAQREHMGTVRFEIERETYEADVAFVRERLSDDDLERTWAEGRDLTLEDAVAYASRGRGERKRPTVGWASLTPTELEVVKLAAEGLTNPQIGERMFVARSTVKAHLSSVFRKLAVSSRAELAAEAVRKLPS